MDNKELLKQLKDCLKVCDELTKEKEFNKKLYLDFCMNFKYNDRKNNYKKFIKNEQNRVRNCRNILAKKYHLYVLSQMERGRFTRMAKEKLLIGCIKGKR